MKIEYKWIALTNTTIGALMASIESTVVLISLPAIFSGLGVDPLAPGASVLLLWVMMSYAVVTTMLVVSFGRIADMFGRVRLYNLGFVIFTFGALLCALTPSSGTAGALELIVFRMVEAVGGACLFANSVAILTDAFPLRQRGLALGINQIAFIAGNVIGVVLGGILAAINWRLDFLISVPVGIAGSIWAYVALREIGHRRVQPLDLLGNVTFAAGLLALMFGLTEALAPYGGSDMGWTNPVVLASLAAGALALVAFVVVERRATSPMFDLEMFRIRGFLFGNIAAFLFSLARGGLQFMLIIWLQGIWLPLHGVAYADTPLRAGIAMMPLMFGFVVCGPLGGWLSDRYGARVIATGGILVGGAGALLLMTLPADFDIVRLGTYLFVMGAGMGFFGAPNTSQIMSSVPAEHRGSAAGMRMTIFNAGATASQAIFFTLVVTSLGGTLGPSVRAGAEAIGLPGTLATGLAALPPGGAIFAAMLGYDPISHVAPAAMLSALPASVLARISDPHFFAGLLAGPFVEGIRLALLVSVVMCVLAGAASALRGGREQQVTAEPAFLPEVAAPVAASAEAD